MDDEIETLGWIETTTRLGLQMKSQVWLRANPPAMARMRGWLFREHLVFEGFEIRISNWHGKRIMAHERELPVTVGSLKMRLYIPQDKFTSESHYADEAGSSQSPHVLKWDRKEETRGGQNVLVYTNRSLRQNFEIEVVYTIDADTRRIVSKAEREFELGSQKLVSETVSDRYTVGPPPRGMFEIKCSKLATRTDMAAFRAKHSPPITDEVTISAIKSLIDAGEAAWRSGEWNDYAKVWKFSAYNFLPDEATRRLEFENHAGNWAEWASFATQINRTEHINIPTASHSFSMMPVRGTVVQLYAELRCSRGEGRAYIGRIQYYLQEARGEYRIVSAQIPFEEIAIKTSSSD